MKMRHGVDNGKTARFYNLEVKNLHDKKIAFDCIAYLESVIDLNSGENKKFPPIEFKWSALNVPRVMIPPLYSRSLDAFYVNHETPNDITFSINSILGRYDGVYNTYTLKGPGKFEVTFVVFSFNFSPVRETFVLEIGNLLEEIRFYKKVTN